MEKENEMVNSFISFGEFSAKKFYVALLEIGITVASNLFLAIY